MCPTGIFVNCLESKMGYNYPFAILIFASKGISVVCWGFGTKWTTVICVSAIYLIPLRDTLIPQVSRINLLSYFTQNKPLWMLIQHMTLLRFTSLRQCFALPSCPSQLVLDLPYRK